MNIYERLIEILIEQKEGRTKPSSTKAQKKANKKISRAARDALRQAELDRDFGDTGVMKQGDRS